MSKTTIDQTHVIFEIHRMVGGLQSDVQNIKETLGDHVERDNQVEKRVTDLENDRRFVVRAASVIVAVATAIGMTAEKALAKVVALLS